MKLKELIIHLEDLMDLHGDIDVRVTQDIGYPREFYDITYCDPSPKYRDPPFIKIG